jgi:hypothetical protein
MSDAPHADSSDASRLHSNATPVDTHQEIYLLYTNYQKTFEQSRNVRQQKTRELGQEKRQESYNIDIKHQYNKK